MNKLVIANLQIFHYIFHIRFWLLDTQILQRGTGLVLNTKRNSAIVPQPEGPGERLYYTKDISGMKKRIFVLRWRLQLQADSHTRGLSENYFT